MPECDQGFTYRFGDGSVTRSSEVRGIGVKLTTMATWSAVSLTTALTVACSSGTPAAAAPQTAIQVLRADGYAPLGGIPATTTVLPASDVSSQAVGVSTTSQNVYQYVAVAKPAHLRDVRFALGVATSVGNGKGVKLEEHGLVMKLTGTLAAFASLSSPEATAPAPTPTTSCLTSGTCTAAEQKQLAANEGMTDPNGTDGCLVGGTCTPEQQREIAATPGLFG